MNDIRGRLLVIVYEPPRGWFVRDDTRNIHKLLRMLDASNFMRNKCNVCEETDAIPLHIYIYNFANTRREQIFLKLIYI